MPKTFLFYDIETSGLNPAFDQVIQFAAIRTDMQLNELERYEWMVRPNPGIVPSPRAMITHRTPLQAWQQGESEFVVIKRIHELFNTPGTISLGYNTLGFDDEFLRFSFYRNLLAPYTHQFANSCGRADLYPITSLFYLFHPSLLTWPLRNEKISLKLDALNTTNHLSDGVAHNAIVDIEATIALAKIFMQQTDTWKYALGYFDKNSDNERQQKLPKLFNKKYAVLVDGIFGSDANFCAPVLYLDSHYHYKNQACWLRLDGDDLSDQPWVINKKMAEPGFLLPASEKYLAKLSDDKKNILKKNITWLEKNPEKLEEIKKHYCDFTYPKFPNVAPEAALYYQGFWNDEQQRQMQQFHRAAFDKKSETIERISHPLLKILAVDALGRCDRELLSIEQADIFDENCEAEKMDYKGRTKLTTTQAIEEIQHLKNDANLDDEQLGLLQELQQWLSKRMA